MITLDISQGTISTVSKVFTLGWGSSSIDLIYEAARYMAIEEGSIFYIWEVAENLSQALQGSSRKSEALVDTFDFIVNETVFTITLDKPAGLCVRFN